MDNKLREIYIYCLSDPDTGEVRYIGKTVRKLHVRYSQHISQSRRVLKKDHTHCWIKSLWLKDKWPTMSVIEICYNINREKYWISYYKEIGARLTNINSGGDEDGVGTFRTPEQKKNISNGKLNSRKFDIYEVDENLNIINTWHNYKPLSEHLDVSLPHVHSSIKRKAKIKGRLFLLEEDYEKIVPLYEITDTLNNIYLRFYNEQPIKKLFNLSSIGIIYRHAESGTLYRGKYKITHNKRKHHGSLSK